MEYNILIFDSYEIIRAALDTIISKKLPDSTIYKAKDSTELIEFSKILQFDLIIVDIQHNGLDEFSIIRKLKLMQPKTKILVFSFTNEPSYKLKCFRNGAIGFLNKSCSEQTICQVLNVLILGKKSFTKEVKINFDFPIKSTIRKSKFKDSIESLSTREYELANMLVKGESNVDISKKLQLAMSTISTYKKRILIKTNTDNLIQLAEVFSNRNMIHLK